MTTVATVATSTGATTRASAGSSPEGDARTDATTSQGKTGDTFAYATKVNKEKAAYFSKHTCLT